MHPEFAFPSAAAHPGPEGDLHCGAPWASWPPTCSGRSAFPGTCWLWTSRSLWPACWQTQTLQWWHTGLRSDRRTNWDPHSTSSHLWPWGSTLQLWKGGWDTALCPGMYRQQKWGSTICYTSLPGFLRIYNPAARIQCHTTKSQVIPAGIFLLMCFLTENEFNKQIILAAGNIQ